MITHILDRPIAFHRAFVGLGMGVTGALMLSQAVYWSSRTRDANGWFYKTQADWEEETGLTRYEQEGARKKLRSLGVLEEVKRGVPCKTNYRVNTEALDALLIQYAENQQTRLRKTSKQVGGNSTNKPVENPQSITETTAETTTETTDILGATAPPAEPGKPVGKAKAKRGSQLPEDFTPSQQHHALAAELGVNLAHEVPQFRDYHQAKGSVMKDWHAALRTWIRNAAKFKGNAPQKPSYFRQDMATTNYREGVDDDGRF